MSNADAIKPSRISLRIAQKLERLGVDVESETAWEEVFDRHEPILSLAEQQIIFTADQPSFPMNWLVGLRPSCPVWQEDGFRLATNHGLELITAQA